MLFRFLLLGLTLLLAGPVWAQSLHQLAAAADASAPAAGLSRSTRWQSTATDEPQPLQAVRAYYLTRGTFTLTREVLYVPSTRPEFDFDIVLLPEGDREARVLELRQAADGTFAAEVETSTGVRGSIYVNTLDELGAELLPPATF